LTNYSKGAAFERRCLRFLREQAWGAIRSAGSHKPCDLVAWRKGEVLMIECKTNGRLDPAEWNLLFEQAQFTGALPLLAMRVGREIVWRQLLSKKVPGCRLKNYFERRKSDFAND